MNENRAGSDTTASKPAPVKDSSRRVSPIATIAAMICRMTDMISSISLTIAE